MLTLNDGRSELWQWDTGRKLSVDADCSQVHFSNKVFGRSIDVDVIDGYAIIPDILLQTDKDLSVWAFVGTSENGYTKISKTFKVNRRNKPADYVFTPPDQTSLEEIKERIDALEEKQDPDAIKNAVEDYMEQNPVEFPVKSVNGKTGQVKLTAEDVGAISQDDLQNATNEALAKAKASGEFDGKDGADGKDGTSATHSWNGTVLTITSASGTSSADLKGDPGEPGVDGADYILTDADKTEIAEMAAELVEVPDSGGNAEDGFSPIATVEQTDTGAVISITDKDGTTTATITNGKDGKDGADGQDGYTPQKGIDYFDGQPGKDGADGKDGVDGKDGYTPVKGVDYFDGQDGSDGQPGKDGISPVIAVSAITGGHRITITYAGGTKTVDVMDGATGRGVKTIFRTSGNGAAGTTDTYTITYTDNTTSTFSVYNGKDGARGDTGPAGANATINGVNALTIAAGDGISASQSGNTLNISVVGKAPEYTYSTTDLTAGTSALATGKMHLVYE